MPSARDWAAYLAPAGLVMSAAALLLALRPGSDRLTLTALILLPIACLLVRAPKVAVLATLGIMPLVGWLRRILIPVAGWSSFDPLLGIALAVGFALLIVTPRGPAGSRSAERLPKLVLALGVLSILAIAHPLGGGLAAGLVGSLLTAGALVWFPVGRRLADDRLVGRLLLMFVFLAAGIAVYGLSQTVIGFTGYDRVWTDIVGATSADGGAADLSVNGQIRAFGTLASAAEYNTFIAAAVVIVIARLLAGKRGMVVLLPILVPALLVGSLRTAAALALLGIIVVAGLRTGSMRRAIPIFVLGLAVAGLTLAFVGRSAGPQDNALLGHELGGLTDPLNPDTSSLVHHANEVGAGTVYGFTHPLGIGPAATTLAAGKLGVTPVNSEWDSSNEFISLGIVGGLLFAAIVGLALYQAGVLAHLRKDWIALGVVGFAITLLGQWLNGAFYAMGPVVWFLLGWVSQRHSAITEAGAGAAEGRSRVAVSVARPGLAPAARAR